jgi:hypothetical protein
LTGLSVGRGEAGPSAGALLGRFATVYRFSVPHAHRPAVNSRHWPQARQ